MKQKSIIQIGLGGIVGVVIAALGAFVFARPYTFQGSVIDQPGAAADFALEKPDGSTFRLSEQRGNVVLLFFGYTRCPDVCPTTLYDYAQIMRRLGAQANQVRFAFVTVDAQRDSLEHLGAYAEAFDPRIIALSGSAEDLAAVYTDYGVYIQKNDVGSAAGYLIDHTARVYVVDSNGDLRLTFPFGMDADDMADDVSHLVGEG